ncbi:MAG: magnesium transporter [Acidobacteriota bacterium]|nr:magnesium transporter [Acidobacteriota bacterium]
MTRSTHHRTSVSALMAAPVLSATADSTVGRIKEFAVSPLVDAHHVFGLVLRHGGRLLLVPIAALQLGLHGEIRLQPEVEPEIFADNETILLLERDLLDQQIIDVNGHKVVRVNDVNLVWEHHPESAPHLRLRIAEVEIGLRGAVRRLLKGLPRTTVERVADRFKATPIPWNFVDLIDRDPARRVRLKIEQEGLARIHPSDLADILEELAPAERQALFQSLDEDVAAEALEEVTPKLQQTLIESLDSEQIAGIVEEMDPGAAADLLSELSDERSEAILDEMDPEERQEVEELLEFSGDSAAGRMTTEYIALPVQDSVATAIAALREFEGDVENVTEIYLLDDEQHIVALIPLVQLLLAPPHASLQSLPHGHLVTCHQEVNGKKVAELFDKYNLHSLPVLDDERKLVGVVHAEQVISLLRSRS